MCNEDGAESSCLCTQIHNDIVHNIVHVQSLHVHFFSEVIMCHVRIIIKYRNSTCTIKHYNYIIYMCKFHKWHCN